MKSKTIILSADNKKSRGILTIYEEDELLKCKLRLYETPELNRFCKLGLYHNNEVFSANLLEKSGTYLSSFVGDFDINKDFYTAIIDTSNNNQVVLSGGTYSGYFFNNQNKVFENLEQEDPTTNLYDYEEEIINQELENVEINEHVNLTPNCEPTCDMCVNCKYKEYFYANQEQTNIADSQLENFNIETESTKNLSCENLNTIENESNTPNKETSILKSLIPQFKYVFENYQADEILNGLIPNGKFVKIEENNEQFSIGAIYENEEMKYICYAVLKDYNSQVPQELGAHYQWLPLDKEDPLSEGYYIVFQDAQDLKIVEL